MLTKHDKEIAFSSTRETANSVWAVNVADGKERKVSSTPGADTVDAPSWGPGGKIVYHTLSTGTSRLELDGKPITGDENVFDFRVSWTSPTDFYYVSDGRIRRRSMAGGAAQTIGFKATLQPRCRVPARLPSVVLRDLRYSRLHTPDSRSATEDLMPCVPSLESRFQ